ncbi:MAG: hypothetical protein Q9171_003027 [Xanthocarpia ochracea]
MSASSTAAINPKGEGAAAAVFERHGVFPFLSLPPELRYMVYKYALISPSAQPGIADILQKPEYFDSLEDDEDIPDRYIHHESIPAATVLSTSKQVYSEANSLLYSHNRFTTFFRPKGKQIGKVLDALAEARGHSSCPCSTGDWVARAWVDYHDVLAQGISQINSPDLANLPYWLFGDFAPSTVSRSDHWDSWSFDPVLGPYGFFFAAFLRKIDFLNIYDYDLDLTSKERNNSHAQQAVVLFRELRRMLNHLPYLSDIKMTGCTDKMHAMVDAVLEEKRTGKIMDLEKTWATIFEETATGINAVTDFGYERFAGYRFENYGFFSNWEKSWRNDCM